MALRILAPLIAWPSLVHFVSTLHVDSSSRKGSSGPEWVDEAIMARADWAPRVKECSSEGELREQLHDMPAEVVKPVAIQGHQTEFSDLSLAEMAWVEEQYKVRDRMSLSFIPPNTSGMDLGDLLEREGGDTRELPLTTGECKPAHGGYAPGQPQLHTCRFENVYAVMGGLEAHVLESDRFPSGHEMIYTQCGGRPQMLGMKVHVFRHGSRGAFQEYMRTGAFARLNGTTLAFEPKWHFNIGHALYDGLYPAFVALVQWGMEQAPFRVLKLGLHNPAHMEEMMPGAFGRNEEVLGLIGGRGIVPQHALHEDKDKRFSIFETLVIGMGRNGQKLDMNGNFSLGGGRDLGGARLFRSHAYASLGIPAQPPAARAGWPEQLEGIIIDNRRWKEKRWIDQVRSKAAAADVRLEFVEWGKAPDAIYANGGTKHNPSPSSGQFREQILLVSRTRIHVSAPGTGMMYQHFLPDGAVHINLGKSDGLPRLFMEEYMAEGAPYIRALYYWPAKGDAPGYDADRVMELVLQAKELVRGGFEIPVPVNTNLSPTMRVVKAFSYLTQDEEGLRSQTPLSLLGPRGSSYDTNSFKNHFPHEFLRQPTPSHKALNPCLLRELTRDYGEPCDKCEWGFP